MCRDPEYYSQSVNTKTNFKTQLHTFAFKWKFDLCPCRKTPTLPSGCFSEFWFQVDSGKTYKVHVECGNTCIMQLKNDFLGQTSVLIWRKGVAVIQASYNLYVKRMLFSSSGVAHRMIDSHLLTYLTPSRRFKPYCSSTSRHHKLSLPLPFLLHITSDSTFTVLYCTSHSLYLTV